MDIKEENEDSSIEEINAFVLYIKQHEDDFFGAERCLRCIDKAMRKQVLENVKQVRQSQGKPAADRVRGGKWVYQPVYPSVLDKLNELLGSYHETHTLSQSPTATKTKNVNSKTAHS